MRITAAALLALLLGATAAQASPPAPPAHVLAEAYPRLHQAAERGPAHAGRDVLSHGRPADGRLSWALVRREAERLWRALHPAAYPPEPEWPSPPAWWLAQAERLRGCEAGGNYATDTGNGYHGAYQFDLGTWAGTGGSGNPAQASPAEQDHRAWLLWQARGWAPWPACSAALGLR